MGSAQIVSPIAPFTCGWGAIPAEGSGWACRVEKVFTAAVEQRSQAEAGEWMATSALEAHFVGDELISLRILRGWCSSAAAVTIFRIITIIFL